MGYEPLCHASDFLARFSFYYLGLVFALVGTKSSPTYAPGITCNLTEGKRDT